MIISFISIDKNEVLPKYWFISYNKLDLIEQFGLIIETLNSDPEFFKVAYSVRSLRIFREMIENHKNWSCGKYLIKSNLEDVEDIGLMVS